MSRHLNDGQLRAALDGELQPEVARHLAACERCQERQHALAARKAALAQQLAFLSGRPARPAPSAQASLRHFYAQTLTHKEKPMLKRLLASTPVRVVTIAALVLAIIISVPSARALADELLNLFRVQQVAVISIDSTGLEQLTGNGALGKQISQLISSSVEVTKEAGDPQPAADAAEASRMAAFEVRLPDGSKPTSLSVRGSSAFDFTIDRAKAQGLLDEAGRSDLLLPESIDGAVISVSMPASIQADYGTCPDPDGSDSDAAGSRGRRYADCVILSEIPSPTVNAPAGVDVAQLAQIGLEFTGMSSDQAAAFTQSIDWTSTLVIPVPKNAATYNQVSVDGVTGTLIQRPSDDAPQYVLIWVKDGIIYAIGGLGSDSQRALDMANSLP